MTYRQIIDRKKIKPLSPVSPAVPLHRLLACLIDRCTVKPRAVIRWFDRLPQ